MDGVGYSGAPQADGALGGGEPVFAKAIVEWKVSVATRAVSPDVN
jgi:hypothetical protein